MLSSGSRSARDPNQVRGDRASVPAAECDGLVGRIVGDKLRADLLRLQVIEGLAADLDIGEGGLRALDLALLIELGPGDRACILVRDLVLLDLDRDAVCEV